MARTDNSSNTGVDGSTAAQRITEAGYQYRVTAENIAAGRTSAEEVARDLDEQREPPAHIVNCEPGDLGVAYVAGGNNEPFSTQDFGAMS